MRSSSSPTTSTTMTTTRGVGANRSARGAARPLVFATVLFSVILVLLYFLINFPLHQHTAGVSSSNDTSEKETKAAAKKNGAVSPPTVIDEVEEDIYRHLGNTLHRRQIPLIHTPFLYQIRLKLFLPWKPDVTYGTDDFSLEGHVKIHFVSGGGSRIVLHSDASEQHIGDCVVTDEFQREITVKHVGRGFSQILDLHLSADMINGMNYTLDVSYRGHIATNKQKGLFAVPYRNQEEIRVIAGTHLQLSEARTVFPCIDTPEIKAHFDTIIVHPTGTTAVANMMENTTIIDGNWTTTSFHRTPPMSTYLFAFVVSDFPFLESLSAKGVRTRVYCDPAKLKSAELMVNSLGPLIGFFEDYFEIPYPLDKLDVFVLPALEVTAMENWGLITVRQAEALYTPNRFPIAQKHNVQEVISHEVAHQWFGNLVTMKWWNNLWLNEGFATMIGPKAVDFLENTTFRYQDMTAEFMCGTLRNDQLDSSDSVSTRGDDEIQKTLEISSSQRVIVYRKAAMITRMIERLVQEEIFRQGLHRFLNTFMYKNADHDDLFNVLTYVHDSSSGGHLTGQNFSLSDVMDTWLRQPSFPVVYVNRKEGSIVTLRQQRYKHVPFAPKTPRDSFIWKIPIFYDDPVTSSHKVFWITDRNPVLFDMAGQLVVDPHQLTYMRLCYDVSMYADITAKLLDDYTAIPTNSRSRLIDDTLAMAEHGQISYEIPFNMTMYLPKERAFRPFQTFSAYLDYFIPRMFPHSNYTIYRQYLLLLLAPQFDRFESEGLDIDHDDDVDYFKLRDLIVFRSCLIGYERCVQMAKRRFSELKMNCSKPQQLLSDIRCNSIPFYLRQHIYAAVIQHGTPEDFDFLIEKWENEHLIVERDRIWYGMCNTHNRTNSDRMWLSLLRNKARENVPLRAVACSRHLNVQSLLLELMVDEADEIRTLLHKSQFEAMVSLICRQVNTISQLSKIQQLVELYGPMFGPLRYEAFLVRIEGRMEWRRSVAPWLVGNATEASAEIRQHHDSYHL